MKLKKSFLSLFLSGSLILSSSAPIFAAPLEDIEKGFAKNVIFMIPDGMSQGGVTLARWVYNDGKQLNMDSITTGMVQTHNADTAIADSAPAASAMATGIKTQDKRISVTPENATLIYANTPDEKDQLKPVATVLEAAKLAGKSTGIVSTSEVQHATPAAFTSHALNRKMYTDIGEQQVYQGLDVVMGGGISYLLPDPEDKKDVRGKQRADGENLQTVLEEKGYDIVRTRNDMMNSDADKIWGSFSEKALSRELDRETSQPKLAEMTKKSIEVLSRNDKGFFLMVEGSQVDWAAHANDTVGIISEIKAFDEAVGVALDYARSNEDTVVIIASDHANSGITIGNEETSHDYSKQPIEVFTKYLKKATLTEEKAAGLVVDEKATVKEAMQMLGIDDVTEEEIKKIESFEDQYDISDAMNKVVSQRSRIGYTTLGGHTGEDIALYTYAPEYKNLLTGTVDNHVLGLYAAKVLGFDLDQVNKELFISNEDLDEYNLNATIDTSDEMNPVLEVSNGNSLFSIPVNKNIVISEDDKHVHEVNGITVYNGKRFYIPKAMIDYMR